MSQPTVWDIVQGMTHGVNYSREHKVDECSHCRLEAELKRLAPLVDWLRKEAEQLIKKANSRKDTATSERSMTDADRRAAKKLAERMMGRRLDIPIDEQSAIASANLQDRIAAKLEVEAQQLYAWADTLGVPKNKAEAA